MVRKKPKGVTIATSHLFIPSDVYLSDVRDRKRGNSLSHEILISIETIPFNCTKCFFFVTTRTWTFVPPKKIAIGSRPSDISN